MLPPHACRSNTTLQKHRRERLACILGLKAKDLKTATTLGACLGCLAPALALAQPIITVPPSDKFLNAPGAITFSVTASGAAPLTYQWLFDGTAIVGATNRVFTLTNSPPAAWGYYSVIVSNASGSVTSRVAELKVLTAAPHSFSGIQGERDGSMSLIFAGETTAAFAPYYDLYPLETSPNLVDWAPLVTLERKNTALDTLSFLDTNAPAFSQRFCRTPTNRLATPDPAPTGPYPVGTFSMVMIDPSRTNAAGYGTNYQFMTTFWYPTVPQAGVLPAKYLDLQLANAYGIGPQIAALFSHSLSNAPLATNLAEYPVILYSPGTSGHRRESTANVEELASWGYVVVGLDTSDSYLSVFPDGRVVYGGSTGSDQARLQDMQFVLGQLAILNAGDPRLSERLDLDRIGAMGWSWGGAITEDLCLSDPRCKAAVGFEPGNWVAATNLLTQPLNVPYLFLRGDVGPDPDPQWTPDGYADERLEAFDEQNTNAYYVKLVSTVHGSLVDDVLIYDPAVIASAYGTPMSGQFLAPARASQIVRAYLLSFFNKFLKGEDDHLLEGPSPAYPEVIQFLSASSSSLPPEYPSAGLVQGGDGGFYGTTAYGGASGKGTVFRMTTNGALTILLSFNGTTGSHPVAALVQGSDGNFYGTTACGGTNGNDGTVFQMTPAGGLTTLVSFNGANGKHPAAGLVQAADGNFYGTTMRGGAYNLGTVFKITPGGALSTLVSFNSENNRVPFAALVESTDGNFYGTTADNTTPGGGGTVFKMTPAGALTALVSFTGANGRGPAGGLIQSTNGLFYGTTESGGNTTLNAGSGFGVIFRMTAAGALTILASFNGYNGSYCVSGLVQGSDGNFYRTTAGGGGGVGPTGAGGTVFKMTPAGVLTTLVSFNGANGNSPQAPLVQGSDGNFYGTTTYGGAGGLGTVFRVTPAGLLTTLVSFGTP